MCHLCDDLDYLYPEDLHPTDCIYVAWEVFDLWERNEQEMSTELCYKNNEYLENEWQREYDLKYDHGYYDELYWEEEYEMYSEQEEEYENWLWSLTDDALEIGKEQKLIRYKDKIWNKRKKHIKDTKRHFREVKRHQCWIEYAEVSYHEHVTHKHKRAEKVYTEDEYFDCDGDDINFDPDDYEFQCNGNCAEGYCISCDWAYAMYGLRWDDPYFIEYWGWEKVWKRDYKINS